MSHSLRSFEERWRGILIEACTTETCAATAAALEFAQAEIIAMMRRAVEDERAELYLIARSQVFNGWAMADVIAARSSSDAKQSGSPSIRMLVERK